MDCTALSSDIDHLKSLRDTLQTQLAQATETGQGKSAILSAQAEATAVTDQLLEKYLPNFFEHNPELIEIQLGPHIEGFVDMDGDHANIDSIAPLPDGSALVGGNYGTLHRCYQDSSSHWQLGDYGALHRCYQNSSGGWQLGLLIEGFVDKDGGARNICSIAPLPDGSALVGGDYGTLYRCYQDSSGSWQLGPLIEGFVDKGVNTRTINSIAPLPDGSALIGGNGGALHRCYQDPSGHWQLGPLIEYGTLHRCYQDSSSHWQLGPLIDDFKDTNGARCSIKSIAPLPDGSALVGGFYGSLHRCYQDSSGHWQLGPLIEGFVDKDGYAMNIYSIAPLPDGSTLVGGGRGALHKATQSEPSLSTIKQSLDQIIAKGESYA